MPKSISGAVGKGGKNRFEDVLTIQYLLNCVPTARGGPGKELVLDGLCGNLTNAAIATFQRAALGFADGRVDAGGQTLQTLLSYDPYPSMKLTLPTVDRSGKDTGKRGGNPMNNCWDPFGYYNPSGKNYKKSGYEPPPFEGKQDREIESSYGGKGGGKSGAGGKSAGWKTGSGGSGYGGGKSGEQGQPGGAGGWKTGSGGSGYGGGKSGGQSQPGGKSGGQQKTGAPYGGAPQSDMTGKSNWPSNSNQGTTIIGGPDPFGKTGTPGAGQQQGKTNAPQNQGGIVGKV